MPATKDFDCRVDTLAMQAQKEDNIGDTISIRILPRVVTDDQRRTIWMGGIDPFDFELDSAEEFNPYDTGALSPVPAEVNRVPR